MPRDWQWLIVGGCPRSGTTLLNFMLNDHPRIRLTNENNLGALLAQMQGIFHREQLIARVPGRALGKRESWHREDVRRATLRSNRCLLPMLRALYEANFADQVDIERVRYFGDKFPTYYAGDFTALCNTLAPLTVVHVSRNPLAVVASMLRRSADSAQGKDTWHGSASVADACAEWARAWNFVNGLHDRAGSSGIRVLHVKFEDLLSGPDAVLADIQRFLRVEEPFSAARVLSNMEPSLSPLTAEDQREIARRLPRVVESWDRPLSDIVSVVGELSEVGAIARTPPGPATPAGVRRFSVRPLLRFAHGLLKRAGYEVRRYPAGSEAGTARAAARPAATVRCAAGGSAGKHIAGRDEILEYFAREYRFETVLDVGCGPGAAFPVLAAAGRRVTGVDILPESEVILPAGTDSVRYVRQDFSEFDPAGKFDAVLSSHVIEHMPDTERFLRKFFSFLDEAGAFCLIWPPPKHTVVGGHVHVFNMGMMLYNLVRIGIDCSGVDMVRCDYSQAVIGRLRRFNPPPLRHDEGDIEALARYFPFPARQDFDGDSVPGVIDLPGRAA